MDIARIDHVPAGMHCQYNSSVTIASYMCYRIGGGGGGGHINLVVTHDFPVS